MAISATGYTQKDAMVKMLKADPNWEEFAVNAEQKLIEGERPYVICQGETPSTFIFFYFKEAQMSRVKFILEEGSKSWFYKNGTDIRSANFKKIFDYILHA